MSQPAARIGEIASTPAEPLKALERGAPTVAYPLVVANITGGSGDETIDGAGGADPNRGSGLVGLTDRVETLGGTITVHSPPGAGTSLHVELPLQK